MASQRCGAAIGKLGERGLQLLEAGFVWDRITLVLSFGHFVITIVDISNISVPKKIVNTNYRLVLNNNVLRCTNI